MADETIDDIGPDISQLEMTSPSPQPRRSDSFTSRFYAAESVDENVQNFMEKSGANVKQKNPDNKIRQSRHLPYWAWYIIAKCIGLPLKPNSKPILGTILHALTFTGAITYSVSYTWYVAYDILAPETPRDLASGSVSILLVYFWCSFGYYCKDLGSRLFLHQNITKDIRMHARTVFKINGALFILILGFFFTAANILENLFLFNNAFCDKIHLDDVVCYIMKVSSIVFSVFTFVWNSLVSFVFMSICRTHTIGLRRFIKEIEYDASLMERHLYSSHKLMPVNQDDIWQESLWIAADENDVDYADYLPKTQHRMSVAKRNINPHARASAPNLGGRPRASEPNLRRLDEEEGEISILFSPINESRDSLAANDFEWNYLTADTGFIPVRRLLESQNEAPVDSAATPHTMNNEELLHQIWRLNCRLRFSSLALQRWYASFIALVLLRCSTYLVHWLAHTPSIFDITQFVLPLILLVVLSSAIAEVNFEGLRAAKCIYPTIERIKPIQYLALNPLQMSVYGYGMTHGTIVTVVFAILVGFVTKIVITEISKL